MEKFLNLVVSGAVAGAIYSLIASGLVVTYSATGIFNLSYGAIAFTTAYTYYELHIALGWPIIPAVIVAVFLVAPLIGLGLDRAVFSKLSQASQTAKIVATVGVLVALPAAVRYVIEFGINVGHWRIDPGTNVYLTPGIGPSPHATWRLPGGINFDSDQLIVAILAVVVAIALWLVMHHTVLGLHMRAVVERPSLASLRGVNPAQSSAIAWAIGSLLAGLAGVAAAPIFNSLQPARYTTIMFVATAAAVIGRLRSIPLAFVAGLALGVLENLVTGYVSLTKQVIGLGAAVPFVVLLVGLALLGHDRSRRAGSIAEDKAEADYRFALSPVRRRLPWAIATLVLAIYILFIGNDFWVGLTARGLALALIFLSFVIVSGLGGMVSLAQNAFVTAAGLTAGLLSTRYDVPFLLAALIGVAIAVAAGVVVALPALRLAGLSLALATLALGLLGDLVWFAWPYFGNGTDGWPIDRPQLGPFDLSSDRTFAIAALVLVLLTSLLVYNLGRSPTGRAMTAVRASETAAATSGVSPVTVKLKLFALSAAVAGLGGVVLTSFDFHATPGTYSTAVGLGWLAAVVLWGIRRPGAAVIAGLSVALFPAIIANGFHWASPIPSFLSWNGTKSIYVADILFGLGAVQMAKDPDGILSFLGGQRAARRARAAARRTDIGVHVGTADTGRHVVGPASGVPVLETHDVAAGYGDVGVLSGVDVALVPGSITVLIGSNGAGKSTLCSVLGGLHAPSRGTVLLEGEDVTKVAAHKRARRGELVLPESRGIFPGLSVDENLALWLTTPAQRTAVYDEFPAITARRKLPAQNLSGGEQQILTLAAACVRPPKVLIGDEPTLGLAPLMVSEMMQRFSTLRDEGVAVLLIEERAGSALEIADAAAILELGSVVWSGAPGDLSRDQLAALHLGQASSEVVATPHPEMSDG